MTIKVSDHENIQASVDVDLQLDDILASITSHSKSDRERNENRKSLDSEAIWIADTGATSHVTKHEDGGKSHQESDARTRGAMGGTVDASYQMDIPAFYCNKNGKEVFAVQLNDVQVNKDFNFNLFSTTKMMLNGYELGGNEKRIDSKKGQVSIHI